ncbi:MAG: phytanoyl-CoA dioxygenase [Bacteroidetes bacterium]|nr:MAG: phytanoyl-CoA dioxygenase [Bacteroidota bacterium]
MNEHKYLDEHYPLTTDQVNYYLENRHIKLKHVLDPEILKFYMNLISRSVEESNGNTIPIEERGTYGKAFIQVFNIWTKDEAIKRFIFSKRLAGIAAELMQVEGVRLYHDQALFKESGGGITPWHADQHYWPLSTDKTITAWIPLQAVPLDMGPLEFSSGSHKLFEGRELAIGDKSEKLMQKRLTLKDYPHVIESFDLGEVSFHSGWVFHRAGANLTDQTRKVMTIIYMDKEMRLKMPENGDQQNDRKTWCPGAKIGEVIDTPLNPVI